MLHARVLELSGEGILKLGHNAYPPTAAHAAEDRALSKSGLSRKEDVCLPAVPLCHHTSTGERSLELGDAHTQIYGGQKRRGKIPRGQGTAIAVLLRECT